MLLRLEVYHINNEGVVYVTFDSQDLAQKYLSLLHMQAWLLYTLIIKRVSISVQKEQK